MDLEDGFSGSRVDVVENLEKPMNSDETGLEINGSCVVLDTEQVGDAEKCEKSNGSSCVGETVIENDGHGKEINNGIGSPSDGSVGPKKGLGLKKWRRKKRGLVRDVGSSHDSNLGLKRVLSIMEPAKLRIQDSNIENRSEGSVGTKDSTSNLGVSPVPSSSLPIQISDIDSTFAIGVYFPVGTDSENSEDRSSRFSTAASVPKTRHRGKQNTGKSGGSVVHKGSQGKAVIDPIKKRRGEKVNANRGKIEKGVVIGNHIEDEGFSRIGDDLNNPGNSYSSVESDLRSSVGTVNGRHVEAERHSWSSNYDGEAQLGDDDQADYYNENGGEFEAGLRENDNRDGFGSMCEFGLGCGEEKEEEVVEQLESENHQPHGEQDPLVQSLIQLQDAQIALEKEIQKFGEIGNGPISQPADSSHGPSSYCKFDVDNSTLQGPSLLFPSHSEGTEGTGFSPVEIELIKLRQRVNLLEHELEEASNTTRSKEAKVLEIETILNKTNMPKVEKESENVESDIELECLFKEKLEAEIECLIITGTTQNWEVLIKDLTINQGQMMIKLKEAENRALFLKSQVEELEIACNELLGTGEVLNMHNKVCKYSLFSMIQFILLCYVIGLFLFQLLPHSPGVVPT